MKIDFEVEQRVIDSLYQLAEEAFGKDNISTQAQKVSDLTELLSTKANISNRDWYIDELDKNKDPNALALIVKLSEMPLLTPFVCYCLIDPPDINSRKTIVLPYINEVLEDFFYALATAWVFKITDELGRQSFVANVLASLFDRYHYYRWVDALYEEYQLKGSKKTIEELRRECQTTNTSASSELGIKESSFDFGILGQKIVFREYQEDLTTRIELDITLRDGNRFKMADQNFIDNLTCDLMNLVTGVTRSNLYFIPSYKLVLKLRHGNEQKQFPIDLRSRYSSTCKKKVSKRTRPYGATKEDKEDVISVAEAALYKAAMDPNRLKSNIPGYLRTAILRAVQHEFENISTSAYHEERLAENGPKRILKSAIERSGGELNKEYKDHEDGTTTSIQEHLEYTRYRLGTDLLGNHHTSAEATFEFKQMIEQLSHDNLDKIILSELSSGRTAKQIAEDNGVTEAAISKRMKTLRNKAIGLLKL